MLKRKLVITLDRYIFHIDLNAFYAVAEQIRDPKLKGKPVAIAGRRGKGIITTATYEARAFGVTSAMSTSEALKLCPDLVLVSVDHKYYSELSKIFVNFLKEFTDQVEQVSIDECYLDLTEEIKSYERPLDLAYEIQNELYKRTKLKCSIGISVNKFLAKMASDMQKPMGITLIRKNEVSQKIFPLDIATMHGIGKKTAPLLKSQGIHTIGDLLREDKYQDIKLLLGKNTDTTLDKIQGIGNYDISTDENIKSIGNSSTFIEDVTDYSIITSKFMELSKSVSNRLKKEGVVSNNLTITIRTSDFTTVTRSVTLDYDLEETDEIYEESLLLFDQENIEEPIRLLGIACNRLKDSSETIHQFKLDI